LKNKVWIFWHQKADVFLVQLVLNMPGVLAQIHDEIIEAIGRPALNAIIKGAVITKLWEPQDHAIS
jgi:hypothetical protein